MLPVAKIFPLLLLTASTLFTSGCSSVGVEESAELSLEFAGIASIEHNSERQETSLNWLLANSNADSVSYKIHELQLESLDQLGLEVQDPSTMDGLGHRVYLFDSQDLSQRIVSEGKVLAQLGADITQFQLGTALNPNSNYAYVIKVNTEGIADPNTKVLLLQSRVKDFLATNTYTGCLTGESASPGTITVNFENPEVASKIDIKRDGVLVFSTTNSLTTSFTDMGLAAGSQFTYSCEATIGSEITVGTQALTLSPQDFSYEGCTSATALSESEIELAFAIPVNADRMRIYRNSKEIFSTTKKSVTNFVDEDLKLGRTYKYLCEVEIGELTVEGSTVLQATTLDPVANTEFNGCTSVASLSPTSTQVIFDFPTGAERINVYRDGVQVFSSFSAENTSFTDENLSTGENYEYSCELVIGGRSKFGAEVSGGTVDAIGNISANWQGCVSATAIGTDSIQVIFDRPSDVDAINLYRDGALIFNSTRASITQYVDSTLKEGFTYTYTCEAVSGDKTLTGENILSAKTLVSSPPTFTGPLSAVDVDGNSIQVTWRPASGVPTDHYVVYYQHGSTLDYSTASTQLVGGSMQSVTLDSIGDELTYSIGVRACHDPEETICDSNTTSITLTTQDAGAPQTQGATNAVVEDGSLIITAPWSPSNGLVKTRKAYLRTGSVGGTNLSNYSLSKQVSVSDPLNTPTEIEITSILENTKYHIIVVDSDDRASSAVQEPIEITTSDLTAPPNFAGIAGDGTHSTPSEGAIAVNWIAPTDWTDYAGFKVYTVSGSDLTQIKNCPCTNLDCSTNNLTSCTVTGLDARRTYTLHVRAYDLEGNHTVLDPLTKQASVQTTDTTAPQGLCCTAAEYNAALEIVEIQYTQAIDNQYASEAGATITYELYRKSDSDFSSVSNPSNDGSLIHTTTDSSSLEDIGPFSSGEVFYYTVCAKDASGNTSCSSSSETVTIPDIDKPTITNFTHDYDEEVISWNLTWTMSDGSGSDASDLVATLYRKSNNSETDTATTNDTVVATGVGVSTFSDSGPLNTNGYLHYLLVVQDEAGNSQSSTLTLYDDNVVQISRVHPSEVVLDSNQYVQIFGEGFRTGAAATIGGEECTDLVVHAPHLIACKAPTFSFSNSQDVEVTNSDGSSDDLTGGVSSCTGGGCSLNCHNYTDNADGFADGDGSEEDPYIICSKDHLNNVRTRPNNEYYKLGANIDLFDATPNSFGPLTTNNHASIFNAGRLDGDRYAILNYTYKDPGQNSLGLFVALGTTNLQNLNVLGVDIEGESYIGGLAASASGQTVLKNIFTSGQVLGEGDLVGGLIGSISSVSIFENIGSNVDITGITAERYIGGLVGFFEDTATTSFAGSIYSLGDINITRGGTNLNVGGLFGEMDFSVFPTWNTTSCYSKGDINAPEHNRVGGIAGFLESNYTLSDCQVYGDITGYEQVGGFVGLTTADDNSSSISNSTIYGNVNSSKSGNLLSYTGGFVGSGNGTYSSNVVMGDISGSREVGGFVGRVKSDGVFRLNKVYGSVTGEGLSIGGFFATTHSNSNITMFRNEVHSSSVSNSGAQAYVGGFGGFLDNAGSGHSLIGNYANTSVTGGNSTAGFIGSIGSGSVGELANNFSTGVVTPISGSNSVGGFAGTHGAVDSRSNGSSSRVTISEINGYAVGGFAGNLNIGSASAQILDSYALGATTGPTEVGGFAGRVSATAGGTVTLTHNYSKGLVTSPYVSGAYDGIAGGFLGRVFTDAAYTVTISQSYSSSPVLGENAGGFIERNESVTPSIDIDDTYATGDVLCEATGCGGFVRALANSNIAKSYSTGKAIGPGSAGAVSNDTSITDGGGNFFDSTHSGYSSDDIFSAQTTTEMATQSTFDAASWDFSTGPIWQMPTEGGPPVLAALNFYGTYAASPETYTLNWSDRSDADRFLIVARQGARPDFVPENDTDYSTGDKEGSDEIIYEGTGFTTTHTGFSDRHDWQYKLFIKNSSDDYYEIGRLKLPDDICNNRKGGKWVYVPQDSERGVDGFCVMKYEAKEISSAAYSQRDATPWVLINQQDAQTECTDLGSGYDLISNAQWVSLASNIASTASNWQGGSVGNGSINKGHSTGSPPTILEAGGDVEPCSGLSTSCGINSWHTQGRMFTLSNGQIIWDVAGNVAEFTSDYDNSGKLGPNDRWVEFRYVEDGSSYAKADIMPLGSQKSWWKDTWSSAHGLGRHFSDDSGGAFVRGGRYDDSSSNIGIFQLDTSMTNTDTATNVGFRCSYTFP